MAKTVAALLTSAAIIPASGAADGTWIELLDGSATGLWSDSASWQGGIIANGAGFTANFSTLDVTSDSEIHLDSPRTLEMLIFGDSDPLTPANWTLANNFEPANVLTLSGDAPTIRANGGAGTTLTINTIIDGTNGLTYEGSSTIRMVGNIGHTYTGGTILKGRVETTNLANAPLTIFGAAVAENTLTFDGGHLKLLNTTSSVSAGSLANNMVVNTTGTLEYSGRSFTSGTLTGTGVLNVITHYVRADNGGNWSNFAGTINVVSGDAGVSDFRQTTYNGFAAATLNLGENSNMYFTPNQANNQNPYTGTAVDIGALSGVASATLRGGPITNRVTSFRIGAKGIDTEYAGRITEAVAGALTNVIKNGPGTLTLSGTESGYNGPTTINQGVLAVSSINNGGAVSSIGQSTNVASNLLINGGTLRYIGSGNTTDRLFSIGASGGTIDASGSGALNFTNPGALVFTGGVERTLVLAGSNTGANTISATIPNDGGPTHLTKQGSGTWVLNGDSSYSGTTTIQGGVLGVRSLANGGLPSGIGQSTSAAGNLIIDGGTLRFSGESGTTDRSFTVGSGGATLDASGTGAITFSSTSPIAFTNTNEARALILTGSNSGNNTLAASLANNGTGLTSLTKSGAGTWAVTGSNTYTGGTTISGGTLKVNNTTGSGTGTGAVTVNAGGALGGFGTITGAVTVGSGGHILPGDGVGTLTVGNLSLSSGAVLDYEFTLASGNDLVAVTIPNGLTLNNVGFNLFTAGSATRWTNPGTYNLLQYSGPLGGTGIAGLSVLNPQTGLEYAFGSTGSFITLTITSSVTLSTWNVAGGGSWNTTGNWSSGVPNGQSNVATLGSALTAPATIALDGTKTVGTLQFDNANAYTIAAGSGGSLVLDSGANTAQVSVLQGTHTISAPVTLASATVIDTTANATGITMSGIVSGGGALTKEGPGTLVLSGQNTYNAGTTIAAGTVEVGANAALGTGAVTISGSSALRAGANALTVGNAITIGNAAVAAVDTAGRDLTLSGVIGSANATGALTKSGAGILTLSGANTYQGATTITGGVLAAPVLADGGAASSIGQSSSAPANLVIDGGTLRHTGAAATSDRRFTVGNAGATIEASGTGELVLTNGEAVTMSGTNTARTLTLGGTNTGANTLSAIIGDNGSGATSLAKAGPGTWRLAGANTFTGTTTIQAGTLVLNEPLALQNSTVEYAESGGTLVFGSIFAATLGGLSGSKDLALENEFMDPVPLTVGGNNQSTTYTGELSGFANINKIGTGILSLGGVNTNGGNITVSGGGAIKALVTDAINPGSTITVNNYAGLQLGDGATISSNITAAAAANEFIDVPDVGAIGTLAGNINVGSGGNQLRIGTTGGTLRITGFVNVANASQFSFITRGSVEFADDAIMSIAGGMGMGRGNQAANIVFRDNAVATFGGDVSFGGGQPNPSINFTVRDDAQFNVGSFNVDLNDSSLATNQVAIHLDGGTFTAGSFTKFRVEASQTATINFNGGVLRAGLSNSAFLPALPSLNAYVQQGGAKIDTDFNDVTIEQPLVSDPSLVEADGGLTKLGEGTLTLAGENTYFGPTQVSRGTLLVSGGLTGTTSVHAQQGSLTLGAANRINDAASVVLGTGGVLNTGGFSETLGALTLEGDAAIELAAGASVLRLADSSALAWAPGRLTISGWSGSPDGNGVDQIFFGTDGTGLTEAQIAQIAFLNPAGHEPGLYASKLLSTGELVIIPEPASAALLAGGIGILGLRRRRR